VAVRKSFNFVIEWGSITLVESFFVFRGKGYIRIDEWLRLW